jgi:imidazolonepropionase-like amidohydrolase
LLCLLKNATIVNSYDEEKNVNILIKDGLINAISEEDIDVKDNVYDMKGYIVLPGFINTHVHLVGINETFTTPDLAYWLKSGITSIRDQGVWSSQTINEITAWRDECNKQRHVPSLYVSGKHITSKNGYSAKFGIEVDTKYAARETVKMLIDAGVDHIKTVLHTDNSGNHQNFSYEHLYAICDEAHKLNKKVSAHVNSRHNLKILLKAGIDEAAHCCMDRMTDDVIEYMVKNKIYMTPTLCVYGEKTLPFAMDNAKRFVDKGGVIGLGNDYISEQEAENPQGMPYKEIMRLHQAGLTARQIIDGATRNGAKILGKPDLGEIQINFIADIIAFKGNPYQSLENLNKIDFVMKKGIVVKNSMKYLS